MKIGFIGLGNMGGAMAGHLLAAGHDLVVWARRPEAADALIAAGARWAPGVEALASQAEIVCTNVTGGPDVLGLAHAMLPVLRAGCLHIDFSTIAPATAREIARRYGERGVDFVDAPVSGGPSAARAATLSIMWGGKSALAARLEPVFRCIGKTVVRIGDAGAGQVAKSSNQLVMVAAIQACAEAAQLAAAAGVDFALVREAMLGGSAGSRVLDVFGAKMAARDFVAGVEARLHHKDFVMIMDAATRAGIPLPVSGAMMQQLDALMAAGWGTQDTSRLFSVLEKSNRPDPSGG